MAYTVLARKYRPQTFADLVGQDHVTRTLTNAIRSERVAHAFLFTGVRGVGKTTTARIVAKALNCEKGPTPEPCGVCDPCREVTAGRDTDVIEMDGASNNSVEDVRRLQESIPYRPSRDRFKIVIVDEVHMLSTGAFNAFLKTLEEPPPHVKFIFATTESHKVPVTIRSRCQRYDFRLIPQSVVSRRVREILASEGIEADDAAVAIVAREAAGSMRDALTLLDQIVAFGGEKLVGEEVARVLGIADREVLHRVARAVLEGDGAEALRCVDELADRGLDMLHFARQLLDLVRDMVVLRVCGGDTELVSLVEEERARARELAERVELMELHRAFSALSKVVDDVGMSGTPRTTLEMGLVRLATRPPLRPLAELVARLEDLERRAGGGSGGGGPKRGPARTEGGGRPGTTGAARAEAGALPASDVASPSRSARATSNESAGTNAASADRAADDGRTNGGASSSETASVGTNARTNANGSANANASGSTNGNATRSATSSETASAGTSARTSANGSANANASGSTNGNAGTGAITSSGSSANANASGSTNGSARTSADDDAHTIGNSGTGAGTRRVTSPQAGMLPFASTKETDGMSKAVATGALQTVTTAATTERKLDTDAGAQDDTADEPPEARAAWARIVAALLESKPALGAVLQHGAPLVVSRERIVLAFPQGSFFGHQAESRDGQRAIADAAERILGERPRIEVVTSDEAVASAKTLAQEESERREARTAATRERALSHPLVHEIAMCFNVPRERMTVRVELD